MVRPALLACALLGATCAPAMALDQPGHGGDPKFDSALLARAHAPAGSSRVIIRTLDGSPVDALVRGLGGIPGDRLPLVNGQVAVVPDAVLDLLAESPRVTGVSADRPVYGTIERTAGAIGAEWARERLGLDGSGIGIAIIDSGVTSWHDDLGSDRVVQFVDFVGGQPSAYDDYGHGTHVAGIVAGSGYDSGGARRGIAPGSKLVVLKALDGNGDGFTSRVIAALNYAIQNRETYNIRIINLSVASGVFESYTTDPLALAARRAVDAGIVVVTAAGNFGRGAKGQTLRGGITSPGNAPWVLTVGAGSHSGTVRRDDDVVAPFSSRGPTHIDRGAKPDIVAPGVGIESLADSSSRLFDKHAPGRLWGTVDTAAEPYLSLSGTSMAAPVVTGTIALMLQANPSLTPNLVKAVLQFTAEDRAQYSPFDEGAGSLNARGAVQLARELAGAEAGAIDALADPTPWGRQILWGATRITGPLRADAGAWRLGVTWGARATAGGEPIVWESGGSELEDQAADDWTRPAMPLPADELGAAWGATCEPACAPGVWGGGVLANAPSVTWHPLAVMFSPAVYRVLR